MYVYIFGGGVGKSTLVKVTCGGYRGRSRGRIVGPFSWAKFRFRLLLCRPPYSQSSSTVNNGSSIFRGQKNRTRKKNKFLGTEVPRNFSDQCSLDFAYFLCLFSGRRAKSSQELCSWELFFSYFRWFFSFSILQGSVSVHAWNGWSGFDFPLGKQVFLCISLHI